MKIQRQSKLLEIIQNNDIETQSELLAKLNEYGFHATQATVSRDIKELRLIKIPNGRDKYKYAAESVPEDEKRSHSYLFTTAVTSIDYSHSLVVIRLSRVFSNTTVQKHQFFGTQLSSQSNSHIHT